MGRLSEHGLSVWSAVPPPVAHWSPQERSGGGAVVGIRPGPQSLDGAGGAVQVEVHTLGPTHKDVLTLLKSLPTFTNGHHLFSTSFGQGPVTSFGRAKQRLDKLMAMELGKAPAPFRLHDVRRTVRTRLASLRIADEVAEMIIGHGRKGIQRVYDLHQYENEMREALELWAARLRDIVTPPPENVVPLKKERA